MNLCFHTVLTTEGVITPFDLRFVVMVKILSSLLLFSSCSSISSHCIVKRLNTVDKMTWYCGYPSPNWLRAMIIKLYKQMTEIRVHAKKDCQKILQPESDFSPTIQMWYDRIHAYLQLIRLKEGNASNISNIVRFAKRKHIERLEKLTMDELKDRLQFC